VQEPPGTQLLDLGGVRVETFNGRVLGRSFFESVGLRIDVRAHELTLYPAEAVHSEPDDEPLSFALGGPLPDTSHCTAVTWDFRHRTVWLEREGRRPADLAGLGLAGAQVVWVFPLGPAAAAGLESGDELVSVNGGSDFDAPFRQAAGARVRVVFRRGHVQRETIVTLKRWQQ
jgi:hypothetical protein